MGARTPTGAIRHRGVARFARRGEEAIRTRWFSIGVRFFVVVGFSIVVGLLIVVGLSRAGL